MTTRFYRKLVNIATSHCYLSVSSTHHFVFLRAPSLVSQKFCKPASAPSCPSAKRRTTVSEPHSHVGRISARQLVSTDFPSVFLRGGFGREAPRTPGAESRYARRSAFWRAAQESYLAWQRSASPCSAITNAPNRIKSSRRSSAPWGRLPSRHRLLPSPFAL